MNLNREVKNPRREEGEVEKALKTIKANPGEWRKPTLEEFKFAGCMLNGPSAS